MKRIVLGTMLFFGLFFALWGCQEATTLPPETPAYLQLVIVDSTTARYEEYDSSDELISTDTFTYTDDDSLLEVLQTITTVYCQGSDGNPDDTCSFQGTYGYYVVGIGPLRAFADNQFISFYINGDFAMTGIGDTELTVGATYKFSVDTFLM
ncbi:MAG: hypothetical protein PHP78_02085 [Candidatus Izemoplasmatales bacterium]|nr:hypothetical protein [Candidatus Izemoplasmatales bacterium]